MIHAGIYFSHYIVLALAALFAGVVDTVTGGGGLVTVPVMLSLGATPVNAFATTRFCGAMGDIVALQRFRRVFNINFKLFLFCIIVTFIASALGTWLLQITPHTYLKKTIPFLLLAILLYISVSPHFKVGTTKQMVSVISYSFI